MSGTGWTASARRIAPLAWPVFIGQISVLAFSTIDTIFVARSSATDLAALAVGAAAYITVFIGFMGVVMALSPIVGQLFGAGKHAEAGRQVHQAVWMAFGLAFFGSALLLFPTPFLALAQTSPEVETKVRAYLAALALSLPASLLFTVYRAFNTAVSRPKAVMSIQISALLLKVPLSYALVFGVPALGLPALGVLGCGISTCMAMWLQVLIASQVLRRDSFYDRFALRGHGLHRPDRQALGQMLRLGLPMGASILVEVTGFAFMAIFIARLGTTAVAGHQLAANLVSLLFMLPLALANASSTLVAQNIGAGRAHDARQLGLHGLYICCGLATLIGCAVYLLREPLLRLYTNDGAVIAAALPLVAWVAVFHVADAAQVLCAFVLRAYKIVTMPVIIYVAALWGVGLAGGYVLAFNLTGAIPSALHGAPGFWIASTVGLLLAGTALTVFMLWVFRRQRAELNRA